MDKILAQLASVLRIVAATIIVCCVVYTALVLATAQALMPDTANGSLVKDSSGRVIGSALIAQKFTREAYFWPRPSAADYDASKSGGSNLGVANPELKKRAIEIVARYHASIDNPVPADLCAASGSGLDPHITVRAALFQAGRIAKARSISMDTVKQVLNMHAVNPGGIFSSGAVVNVLQANIELDRISGGERFKK
jgi:K+-transporting ATPase ATPase C chain